MAESAAEQEWAVMTRPAEATDIEIARQANGFEQIGFRVQSITMYGEGEWLLVAKRPKHPKIGVRLGKR